MPESLRTIGFLTTTSGWGGTELHTVGVARELVSRGHRVVLFELGHDQYSARRGSLDMRLLTVIPVALPAGMGRLTTRFWRELMRRHDLDTVVCPKGGFNNRWPRLDLAVWTAGVHNVCIEHAMPPRPLIRTSRSHLGGLLPGVGLWHLWYRAAIRLHRLAWNRIVAVSGAIKHQLVADYGYRDARVTVVHNGVDASVFRSDAAAREAARARWGMPAAAFVFGVLGRFVPEKRLDRALLVFRTLVRSNPGLPLYLVLMGSGPEDGALRRLALELGVAERCVWPGEAGAPWHDLPGLDCYLLTSESEGLPYSLLEAMACERVSVAVASGGVSEALVDGMTGRLTGDAPADIVAAMRAVLSWSPEERAEVGRRARRHVIERHDQATQVGAVASIIEGLCAGEGSA